MPEFIPCDHNQNSMVVITYQDQRQSGTFDHAIHYLTENKSALSIVDPRYKNDDNGRPAFDLAILLKIILFAYAKGITSSREIQWCCQTSIIVNALSCDSVPHFTTIADFVSACATGIADLFEQGSPGNELFAIDGCKMPSDASKEWSGTFNELAEKREKIKRQVHHHINEHQQTDRNERRDEERRKRTGQAIETVNKAQEKIDQCVKSNSPRLGQGKRPKGVNSNITDNESAKMTPSNGTIQGYNGVASADKKHQVIIDAQAFGAGQEHYTLPPVLETINARYKRAGISDDIYKDGIIATADTGVANEAEMKYLHENSINGYLPDNQFRSRDPKFDQKSKYGKRETNTKKKTIRVIRASEFSFDATGKSGTCPAGEIMWLKKEGHDRQGSYKLFFEGRLTTCRHCKLKHRCMVNPSSADTRNGHGRQVSFVLEGKRAPNFTDGMKHRVDSDKGKQVYGHSMSVVEPVFGSTGSTKRLKRSGLRRKKKVQCQWKLSCLAHNIEKLRNYGELAA